MRRRATSRRSRSRWRRAAAEVGVDFIGGFSALVHKGIGDGDAPSDRLDPRSARRHRARVLERERRDHPRGHQHGRRPADGRGHQGDRRGDRRARLRSAARSSSCSPTRSRTTRSWPAPSTARASRTRRSTSASRARASSARSSSALPKDADLTEVAEAIKGTAFKITRAGELVAREAARRLGRAVRHRRPVARARRPPRATRSPTSSRRWAWCAPAPRARPRRWRC